jgi:hypothetical protein
MTGGPGLGDNPGYHPVTRLIEEVVRTTTTQHSVEHRPTKRGRSIDSCQCRFLRAETRRTALPQARSPRFDAIITPTTHLQEWLHTEVAKRNGSTPVLRVPFHHSRSSAMREPSSFDQAIRTICYYGAEPEPEMVHAVRQWAEAHNATVDVRMASDLHRVGIRATASSFALIFPGPGCFPFRPNTASTACECVLR